MTKKDYNILKVVIIFLKVFYFDTQPLKTYSIYFF